MKAEKLFIKKAIAKNKKELGKFLKPLFMHNFYLKDFQFSNAFLSQYKFRVLLIKTSFSEELLII
jgi:hypothetical protein